MLIYRVHITIVLGKSTFSAFQIGKQTKSDDLAFIGFFYWGFSIHAPVNHTCRYP